MRRPAYRVLHNRCEALVHMYIYIYIYAPPGIQGVTYCAARHTGCYMAAVTLSFIYIYIYMYRNPIPYPCQPQPSAQPSLAQPSRTPYTLHRTPSQPSQPSLSRHPASPAQPTQPAALLPAVHLTGGEWFLIVLFGVFAGVGGAFRVFSEKVSIGCGALFLGKNKAFSAPRCVWYGKIRVS